MLEKCDSQDSRPGASVSSPPILEYKDPGSPSLVEPAVLLRQARRLKGLTVVDARPVRILDPDDDMVRHLKSCGQARRFDPWPCCHADLYTFPLGRKTVGVVGRAAAAARWEWLLHGPGGARCWRSLGGLARDIG
jgi:hypothetical protein